MRGILTIGSDQGGLAPAACVQDSNAALADAQRLIETYHDASKYSMLRVGIGPSTIFEVSGRVGACA